VRQSRSNAERIAFSVALQIPQILDVLLQMASDPNIVGDTILDMGRAN
jgi:hypothetical protein